jgi:hypothetical protein
MKITDELLEVVKASKPNVTAAMDKVEDWVIDSKEINQKIDKFLKNFEKINKEKEISKKSFLQLLAYLHTGNVLNIMNILNSFDDSFCKDLVAMANDLNERDGSKFAKIFSERLLVVYRMNALPRIFSKERLDAISRTVENI